MINKEIKKWLLNNQDKKYQKFISKLIPNIKQETIIGVRVPFLRKYAKELIKRKDLNLFLNNLPHQYLEENELHILIINLNIDYNKLILELEKFLPYINNWAVSDLLGNKLLKENPSLLDKINKWIKSRDPFTVRVATLLLMKYYLGDLFKTKYLKMVANIKLDDYYVKMMIAWYFAEALVKQYDKTIRYLEENKLDEWTHNKTIQKAIESFRIDKKRKVYLKTLKK